MGNPDEQVLVVPRDALVPGDGWLGVRPGSDLVDALAVVAREGRYVRRGDAEEDPSHKQVIPYLVLRDGERWFLMRRTRAGGDARLHDRWSIGVGGHLNPGDVDVAGGLRREWSEELEADFEPDVRAGRAAQRRHDAGRARSTSASCTSPTPRAARSRSARPRSSRAGSPRPRRWPRSATGSRRGAGSRSTR